MSMEPTCSCGSAGASPSQTLCPLVLRICLSIAQGYLDALKLTAGIFSVPGMQKGLAMMKPYSSRQRSRLVGLINIVAGLCVSWVVSTTNTQLMAAPPDGNGMTLYDPDPKHLWNRLHQAL